MEKHLEGSLKLSTAENKGGESQQDGGAHKEEEDTVHALRRVKTVSGSCETPPCKKKQRDVTRGHSTFKIKEELTVYKHLTEPDEKQWIEKRLCSP